jgi:hypothetical protein
MWVWKIVSMSDSDGSLIAKITANRGSNRDLLVGSLALNLVGSSTVRSLQLQLGRDWNHFMPELTPELD